MKILFRNNTKNRFMSGVELRNLTKKVMRIMLKSLGNKNIEVSILIIGDGSMRLLNNKYRGINSPTDVLSFPMTEKGEDIISTDVPLLLGDIAISLETAARQAENAGHSIHKEVVLLLCHGFLHLLHYDDKEKNARRKIFAEQNRWMEIFEREGII